MLDNDTALVIDDSHATRKAVCSILREQLHCQQILEAEDGKTGLALLRNYHERVDWIFCDWDMPRMNGDEVLTAVRSDPNTAHLPFIMITTRSDRDSLVSAVQLGVSAYIVKPFNAKTVIDKVMMLHNKMDRRNADRVQTVSELPLTLHFADNRDLEAAMLDISLSGMLTIVSAEQARGICVFDDGEAKIETKLAEREKLLLPIQIIRLEADPMAPGKTDMIRIALRFRPMEKEIRTHLADFIEHLARE